LMALLISSPSGMIWDMVFPLPSKNGRPP